MPRSYEMMIVLQADVDVEQVPERLDGLRTLVTENGGAVTDLIDWGRRRLAYPIRSNFEGHYLIAHFTSEDGAGNPEMERTLGMDESVLRHLIVRKDD